MKTKNMRRDVEISKSDAIRIVYYLMAVDGEISPSEEVKFEAIAKEIDSSFNGYKAELISECQAQIDKAIDADEYYEVIREGVEEAIEGVVRHPTDNGHLGFAAAAVAGAFSFLSGNVPHAVVVWNLLTIAFSDGRYTEEERKLIKYIVRKLNIDKSIFFEMENTIKTLTAIDCEEKWLKTTSKPYAVIEAQLSELENRKKIIENSVKELIAM